MADEELSQKVREELELARSKVRRRLSYGAGIVLAIITLWGLMWMGDRSIAMVGINACVAIVVFWFGQRKPPEK